MKNLMLAIETKRHYCACWLAPAIMMLLMVSLSRKARTRVMLSLVSKRANGLKS